MVVHGDAAGTEALRRAMTDWASDMKLFPVEGAQLDRMIGYYEPYAKSHEALDADAAVQEEVRNVARALLVRTREVRAEKVRRATYVVDTNGSLVQTNTQVHALYKKLTGE